MKKPKINKLQKDKKPKRTIVQSVQQTIPVKEILDDVIVTPDERIYKVMEIYPTNFLLKNNAEQNKIGTNFQSVLNECPNEIHIKCVATYADLGKQKNNLIKHMRSEKNDNCRSLMQDFYSTLTQAEIYGVQRHYYLSFPYDSLTGSKSVTPLNEAVNALNSKAERIRNLLLDCENMSSLNTDIDNEKLLYNLLNRKTYLSKPYEQHLHEITTKYKEKTHDNNVFIPTPDKISSSSINFDNKKYVVADGLYYSFLFIPEAGFPSGIWPGWLMFIVNSYVNVDVDIFIKRDRSFTEGRLRKMDSYNGAAGDEMNKSSQGYSTMIKKQASINYLQECLEAGQEVYQTSVIVTVCGYTPEEVDEKITNITSIASSKYGMKLFPLYNQEEQAFLSVLPCSALNNNIYNKSKKNMATEGTADNYVFGSAELIDDEGIYFAENPDNQSPIILDSFNEKKLNNAHKFVCGTTGAGKSVTLMSIASKNRAYHRPVYILAPYKQHEFSRLCEEIGGTFVSIGTGSNTILNPMEIFPLSKRSLEVRKAIKDDSEKYSLLLQKISMLVQFIRIKYEEMNEIEESVLEETLIELYNEFGITEDNDSIWNEEHTAPKKMPILSDLYNKLSQKTDKESEVLSKVVRSLTIGKAKHFDGQTNFDVDNEFFVFGLEHNKDDMMMNLSYYLTMEFVWQRIQENPLQKKSFVTDEWWILARNKLSAMRSLEIAKLSRAYRCEMIIATQNMSDADSYGNSEYGSKVLDACDTKILLKLGVNDFDFVKKKLNLTENEQDIVERASNGRGLYITPYVRIPIYFNLNNTEKLLYFTDEETMKKYEIIQNYKKELNRTESIDDLFNDTQDDNFSVFETKEIGEPLENLFDESVKNFDDIFE